MCDRSGNVVTLASGLVVHKWFGHQGEVSTPILPHVAQYLADEVPFDGKRRSVLDMGCGGGQLLLELRNRGWSDAELYGTDIEPTHVELAQMRTGLPNLAVWDSADLETFPFEKSSYWAVTAINWLHNDWRHKYPIGIEPRSYTDKEVNDKVLASVVSLLCSGGWFVFDYQESFPEYLPKTLREFSKDVVEAGFKLRYVMEDVRGDGPAVTTFFYQLERDYAF